MILRYLNSTHVWPQISYTSVQKHPQNNNKQKIKDTTISDEDLIRKFKCVVFEHCIQHAAICQNFSNERKVELLNYIGEIVRLLQAVRDAKLSAVEGLDNNASGLIDRLHLSVDDVFMWLPPQDFFEALDVKCDSRVFFETWAISVKNNAFSFQHDFYRICKSRKSALTNRLKALTTDFFKTNWTFFIVNYNSQT